MLRVPLERQGNSNRLKRGVPCCAAGSTAIWSLLRFQRAHSVILRLCDHTVIVKYLVRCYRMSANSTLSQSRYSPVLYGQPMVQSNIFCVPKRYHKMNRQVVVTFCFVLVVPDPMNHWWAWWSSVVLDCAMHGRHV